MSIKAINIERGKTKAKFKICLCAHGCKLHPAAEYKTRNPKQQTRVIEIISNTGSFEIFSP